MKKNLFSIILGSLLFFGFSSMAQPTITGTGVNPVIGETVTTHGAAFNSPGNSGANQTWNFASWVSTSTSITHVVNPSSTTHGGSFPYANTAFTTEGSAVVAYYKYNSSAMQNFGSYINVVMVYSNPEDLMRYPFTFNNTYTDAWSTQFVNGGYTFYRTGTSTVTADGYGTLITPNGTFTNVLRVHLVQSYQDSAYIGVPYIITYNNDEYMWYKDGLHFQLASTYNLTTSQGSTMTGASWAGSTSGVETLSNIISSLRLYPNPASNNISIDITLEKKQKVEINLYNSLGQKLNAYRVLEGEMGENFLQIDVEQLPEGVYLVEILAGGKRAITQRFLVAR